MSVLDDVLATWEPVIGMETHVELGTASKMFCGCSTVFGAPPNTHVCPVCLGLPGSLPVANEAAIRYTVMIGLALNCSIAPWCRFARKNYFYPDMPKNYQISQYDEPLCVDGWIEIDGERIGIERVHLEEDTGKSLHVGGATGRIHGADYSLVDYNRAGIPLVEIVTRPDIHSAEAARAYVTELRDILRTLGASDVKMEEGSLRCDVNVSLRPRGSSVLGTRAEVKNVNSLRSVERAVRHEVGRQAARLEAGERIVQETRHFHENTGTTTEGRSKEEAQDYRYFPEPDLVPIAPDPAWVASLRDGLPELPSVRRSRLVGSLGLASSDVDAMTRAGVLDLVIETVALGASAAEARNWWLGDLQARANAASVDAGDLGVTPAHVARVCALVAAGDLSATMAKAVFDGVISTGSDPDAVIAERGLKQVSEEGALGAAVDDAIAANPDIAAKVRDGKVAAAGALVGAVMKAMRGQANAATVNRLVLERLGVADG
ncbi:MAG: aspartyl-tRNA(Asn)/glutamyl-tRNA(Gln) amidotransferase subunit [Frankiaceae bacterium]|nr:aspartyl-tRNA(Asn)/glutamyl-tRNA(Gln) amidotransferase subunit [Frankiaceae bacterium]